MNRTFKYFAALCGLGLMLSANAWAQWSSDPNQNLALSDIAGADQVQPKLAPRADNGWYVSWFNANPNDPPPNGYDTYLQRLDANGYEQFAHDGLQVAKLTNSSTEDYGLDVDAQGNALIAFLDTRERPTQQVTVAKISPTGVALWGANGIQVSRNASDAHSPRVAATSDGGVVVAWISDSYTVVQKLDANGRPQWAGPQAKYAGIILGEAGSNYQVADLHASDNGSVIISFSRDRGFRTNRFLYANKISASGQLLWGAGHVKVWDGGSLQLGNYPRFVTDGNGGAVFSWYTSIPSLQVYAQHILANGSEAFQHNGVPVSTDNTNVRVDPAASYRASTQEIFVFWEEEDQFQSVSGEYGQKIDASGARKWGDTGRVIVPLQQNAEIFAQSVQIGDGAFAFWVDQQVTQNGTIQGIRLDNAGNAVCQQFAVSSVDSPKSRPWAGITASGTTAIAFQDYRNGNSDIYIQNVNPDCSLGIETQQHRGRSKR